MNLEFRGFLIIVFQNISFLKEFLECGYASSYLPKLDYTRSVSMSTMDGRVSSSYPRDVLGQALGPIRSYYEFPTDLLVK